MLVFYGITSRHAREILLRVNDLACVACGVAISAHKMLPENYDMFFIKSERTIKLKLKYTHKMPKIRL